MLMKFHYLMQFQKLMCIVCFAVLDISNKIYDSFTKTIRVHIYKSDVCVCDCEREVWIACAACTWSRRQLTCDWATLLAPCSIKKCRHGVEASFFYLCVNKICIISYYFLGLSPNYEFVVFVFPPRKMSPELMISKRLVASDTKELEHEFQVNECFILFLS